MKQPAAPSAKSGAPEGLPKGEMKKLREDSKRMSEWLKKRGALFVFNKKRK